MDLSRFSGSSIEHLRSTTAGFVRGEQGSATVWNLLWLLVFAGMAGLSIDASNGYRNIAISQSTGDTASLGGVIQLPNPLRDEAKYDPYDSASVGYVEAAKDAALDYAKKNMAPGTYGDVLEEDDVFVGHWNATERTFKPVTDDDFGDLAMNAVRVYLFQDEVDRGNGVPTSLMHMAGLPFWSVSTVSTSATGPTDCLMQGFMAKQKICATSHNNYYPGHCLYGQEGIRMNSSEFLPPVSAVMPDLNDDGIPIDYHSPEGSLNVIEDEYYIPFIDPESGETIPGVALTLLAGRDLYYSTPTFAETYGPEDPKDLTQAAVPAEWLTSPSNKAIRILSNNDPLETEDPSPPEGEPSTNTSSGPATAPKSCPGGQSGGSNLADLGSLEPFSDAAKANGADPDPPYVNDDYFVDQNQANHSLEQGKIYYTQDNIEIDGHLRNVIIVTEGKINIVSGSSLEDVTLISLSQDGGGGSPHGVDFTDVRLGNVDLCEKGGEVKIYAMGSISGNGGNEFYGTTLVSGGSVGFSAKTNGSLGLAIYSAGNIYTAAHNNLSPPELDEIRTDGCAKGTFVNAPDKSMRMSIVE